MNLIDLTGIVGIGVMVTLFGRGKLYEMVFLTVVASSVWIWHRYTDVVIAPLDSVAVMVGLYIVAGFLTTLVFVWVFWPVALTWLACFQLFRLVPAAVKKLAAKIYDGLGGIVFGKV